MMKTVVDAECQSLNEDKTIPMQEKITLYLCGLGHLARDIMTETNATDFTTNTILEPKNGGIKVSVKVIVKKVK